MEKSARVFKSLLQSFCSVIFEQDILEYNRIEYLYFSSNCTQFANEFLLAHCKKLTGRILQAMTRASRGLDVENGVSFKGTVSREIGDGIKSVIYATVLMMRFNHHEGTL